MFLSALIHKIPGVILLIVTIVCLCLVIALFYQVELYKIENVEDSYNEYKSYCEKLKTWIGENWIGSKEEIQIIIKRMKKLIEKEKKQRERITSKIFDVLKIFFIPIILVAITSYVDNEKNFMVAFSNILGVSMCALIGICLIGTIWNAYSLVKVQKVAQMERFVDDLQSVLDICFYKIYRGKAKEVIEEQKNE